MESGEPKHGVWTQNSMLAFPKLKCALTALLWQYVSPVKDGHSFKKPQFIPKNNLTLEEFKLIPTNCLICKQSDL